MSGRSDRFGPHYLLDHDLVLVTINYRLASLGNSHSRILDTYLESTAAADLLIYTDA